ncbi:hypothetical protein CWI36_0561p0010 [Hamiltosporidium magnivora]|uniref:Uncharacterized protein n=1 Tax=Hamiltosporidium magnivora TaxID=148818 RepID=A0A4Q9LFH4_9MICR|nr:hypothetical protein CWI36_0561p0010 [Hamiltosporidium magnivora]
MQFLKRKYFWIFLLLLLSLSVFLIFCFLSAKYKDKELIEIAENLRKIEFVQSTTANIENNKILMRFYNMKNYFLFLIKYDHADFILLSKDLNLNYFEKLGYKLFIKRSFLKSCTVLYIEFLNKIYKIWYEDSQSVIYIFRIENEIKMVFLKFIIDTKIIYKGYESISVVFKDKENFKENYLAFSGLIYFLFRLNNLN